MEGPETGSMGRVAFASFIGTAIEFYDFSLLLMGLATFLIGCLPGYTSIGIAAPSSSR